MKQQNNSIHFLATGAAFFLATTSAFAQPPAQGPRQATPNANSLPTSIITGAVMSKVNEVVTNLNASLATNPSYRAVITASQQNWSPYMLPSKHLDQPNQVFAKSPYIVTLKVTDIKAKIGGVFVPYPFSRTITQSIDVHTTCEGWYNNTGKITFTTEVDPPYLEGDHSFAEDAIGFLLLNLIPGYVDSQIRAGLSNVGGAIVTTSTPLACASLGVAMKAMGFPYDSIQYDPPKPILVNSALLPQATVRVVQVKRLAVRDISGNMVGDPLESPELEFWAGHSALHLQMTPLSEGQTWIPQGNATASTPAPGSNQLLVLIGHLLHNGGIKEESSYVTYSSSTNWGHGTQTFQIMRSWFEPSPIRGGKPVKRTMPAYQVTVQISIPTPVTFTLSR